MTDPVNGCLYCGKDRRDHAQEKHDGREGFETWVEPTDEQRKARLLARSAPSADYLDVLFDGPPSHESGRFVEVNDPSGASVNAGEWIERGDGLWVLRIPRLAPATEDEAAEVTFTAEEVVQIANETSDGLGNLYRMDFIDRIRHEASW